MQVLHSEYKNNPKVVILAMNVGDDNAKMARWWKEKNYTFPTLNDADKLAEVYKIKAFPSSIVIGPDGKVVQAIVGSAHESKAKIEETLAGMETGG